LSFTPLLRGYRCHVLTPDTCAKDYVSEACLSSRLSSHRLSCVDSHPLPSFGQSSFTIPPSVCRSLTVAKRRQSAPMLYHSRDVAEAPAPVVLPGGKYCSRTSCCLSFPSFRFPYSPPTLPLPSLAHLVFAPVVFDYATCIHSMPLTIFPLSSLYVPLSLATRGIGSQVYKLKFLTFKCTVETFPRNFCLSLSPGIRHSEPLLSESTPREAWPSPTSTSSRRLGC
jgi:hypothetical protein